MIFKFSGRREFEALHTHMHTQVEDNRKETPKNVLHSNSKKSLSANTDGVGECR